MRRTGRSGIPVALLAVLAIAGARGGPAVDRAPAERVPGVGRVPGVDLAVPGFDPFDPHAPDAVVEIGESLLNESAAALEPVRVTGRNEWKVPDWVPVVGGSAICDPEYTVDVTGITFGIAPDRVSVEAGVRARWCGQAFTADVETTGDIVYDPAQRVFDVTIRPTSVRPSLVITIDVYVDEFKFDVPLPVTIDLAGIKAPPIPVQSFFFSYETSKGSGTLHGTPRDIVLFKRHGYLELQSDLQLW